MRSTRDLSDIMHILFFEGVLMRANFEDQMKGTDFFISMSQADNLLQDPNMQTNFIDAISKNNTIQTLHISSLISYLPPDGQRPLPLSTYYRDLVEMRGKFIKRLSNALSDNTTLQELRLYACTLDANDAKEIGNFMRKNRTLRKLDLSSNAITAVGLKHICDALGDNTQLQELDLTENQIITQETDSIHPGIRSLAHLLNKHPKLSILSLSANKISSFNIKSIGDALLENKTLRSISFMYNETSLDIIAVSALANMIQKNISLETINLTGISIESEHVAILEDALQHNLTLQTLQGGMEQIDGPLSQGIDTYLVRNKQISHRKALDAREVAILSETDNMKDISAENINIEQAKVAPDPSFIFFVVNGLLEHHEASRLLLLVLMLCVLRPYAGKTEEDILIRAISGSVPDALSIAATIGIIYTGVQFFKPKPPVDVLQENTNVNGLENRASQPI